MSVIVIPISLLLLLSFQRIEFNRKIENQESFCREILLILPVLIEN